MQCKKCTLIRLFFFFLNMIDDHLTAPSIRYVFTPKVKNKKKKRIQPLFHCNAVESVDEIIKARKLQWITSKIERKKKKKTTHTKFSIWVFGFLLVCTCANYEWNYEMEIVCIEANTRWRWERLAVFFLICKLIRSLFFSCILAVVLGCSVALLHLSELTNQWKKNVDIQIIEF